MDYADLKYPTPHTLKNKYKNKKALIIGTGHSTKYLLPLKNNIRKKFDVVIGLNFSFRDFEDILDFHMVLEKNPVKVYEEMKNTKCRLDLPRVLNWKCIDKFPQDLNIIKATRNYFKGNPDIRRYKFKEQEGLLIGPQKDKGLSVGTVMLNAIHFAGILGCSEIFMIGADLLFKDAHDHYYPDSHYRKSTTKLANRSPVIDITHKGKQYQTTKFFKESAEYIDEVIENMCKPAGVQVFDFSDGLISKAQPLNIDLFMK